MRDFCRTYENHPILLSLAMQLSWTQNVVIMEAELSMDHRQWYLRAARQIRWSKTELLAQIAAEAYLTIVLDMSRKQHWNNDSTANYGVFILKSASDLVRCFVKRLVLQKCRGSPNNTGGQLSMNGLPIKCFRQMTEDAVADLIGYMV